MKNELNNSTSPYLLQHALNPVHWKVWNEENIENAKNSNKLLLISIGYAACHWCHVMEKECFEDDDVAKVMNTHFINFKIDREELPVVDAYYMQAMQIMTKTGGWPLNVIALPNGLPIWAATYVPKEEWTAVLLQLNDLYVNDTKRVVEYANKLQESLLLANNTNELFPNQNSTSDYIPLIEKWKKSFDLEYGGYSRAPKFMMPTNLNFLQAYGHLIRDNNLLDYIDLTLTKMAYGGLFDTIEGGFSRYSVDHKWHIPHFEKMLYDNAQLLVTYSQAYLRTGNLLYKNIVEKTTHFIITNWRNETGGFYASFDADSLNNSNKLEEGAYYYWTLPELKKIIPSSQWSIFERLFNINTYGYWHEANAYVLIQDKSLENIANDFNISHEELLNYKTEWEKLLLKAKKERSKPRLDNKIITSWNALLLSGLIEANKIVNNSLEPTIQKLSNYLSRQVINDNTILRINDKNTKINGVLEDYAFLIKSFIDLFNTTQNVEHITFARSLTFEAIDLFFDEKQGFFKAADSQNNGAIFELEDNVIPSANAIMCRNLFLIGYVYKNDHFIKTADKMLNRVLSNIDYASSYSEWLNNDIIINQTFQYLVYQNLSKENIDILNKSNIATLYINCTMNLPLAKDYNLKIDQIQICNRNSCLASVNNFNDLFNK